MLKKDLTICYLTKKQNAVGDVARLLRSAFPKVIASRATSIEEALGIKGADLILADEEFKISSTTVPVLKLVQEKDVQQCLLSGNDFITYQEFSTHALIRSVRQIVERHRLSEDLKDAIVHDETTGLFNQRYMIETLNKEVKKAVRYGYPVTVIYMGLDGLKKINAKYGPELGDQAIIDFGLILSNSLRCVDTVGRFSGDEFMAILPETALPNSMKACNRIQNATKNFAFTNHEAEIALSVSIGIADTQSGCRTGDELLKSARIALSGAKKRGAGTVCSFEEARLIEEPAKENRELIAAVQQQIQMLTEEAKKAHFAKIIAILDDMPLYKRIVSHHERTAFYSERLANKIGLSPDDISLVKWSALLHDIGKVAIDERIVTKSGLLSSTEYAIIKQHPLFASQMLMGSIFLRNEANIILHHHEHFDGNGYPDHMYGTQIPLSARIITLAEAWDSMITAQSYRPALPLDQALSELKTQSGKQFDPELVAVFTGLIEG